MKFYKVKEKRLTKAKQAYLDNGILLLKHGSGEGALPSVVEAIRVGAVFYQQLDQVCMSVICGEHKLENQRESHEHI